MTKRIVPTESSAQGSGTALTRELLSYELRQIRMDMRCYATQMVAFSAFGDEDAVDDIYRRFGLKKGDEKGFHDAGLIAIYRVLPDGKRVEIYPDNKRT